MNDVKLRVKDFESSLNKFPWEFFFLAWKFFVIRTELHQKFVYTKFDKHRLACVIEENGFEIPQFTILI